MLDEKLGSAEKTLIVFFRLTMGWTFLYAGIHHFGDDKFVIGFLSHVKTFHDVYAPLTNPSVAPVLTFLVEYGHLLIGLSLIAGLLVRVRHRSRSCCCSCIGRRIWTSHTSRTSTTI